MKVRRKNGCLNLSKKTRGILAVLTGFVWMMHLGSLYMINSLNDYVQSYFKTKNKADVSSIFSYLLLSSMFGNFVGANILKKRIWSPRVHILIGGIIGILGYYLASFATSLFWFGFFFAVLKGFAGGFTFISTTYVAWQYF
jgi:hypothetical protein